MQQRQGAVCGWAIWFCFVAMAAIEAAWGSVAQAAEDTDAVSVVSPFLSARVSLQQPAFTALSVDSLGLGKAPANAVQAPQPLKEKFSIKYGEDKPVWVEYRRPDTAETTPPLWRFELYDKEIRLISQWDAANTPGPATIQFDPRKCHPTLLGAIDPDSSVRLPAVLHFPDQGSFRITATGGKNVRLGYDAWRPNWVDGRNGNISVTFPAATADQPRIEYRWEVAAIYPPVAALEQDPRFNGFRRNWLNSLQLNPRQRVLANHASSDNCAFCLFKYADIARHSPPLAEGLSALTMIRQTLERILGGMASFGMPSAPSTSYPEPTSDTYPSLLIAAWEYVVGSGDEAWLAKHYAGLRAWTEKMLATDRDGNGLIEYCVSGNSGSWPEAIQKRPSNWWDTIGFGHEDAYANALAYRALRSMVELAGQAGKADDAARYRAAADKLRAVYYRTFFNPATGVLAGWRSADGQLHDYYFLFVNGAAIHYGLVPKDQANAIMDRLLAKMKDVGYTRFDLGLPGNLITVPRKDFAHKVLEAGCGKREDNSDGFQIYENGGATGAFAYFTLAALYDLGRRADADRILFPLLDAYERGEFQGFKAEAWSSKDWKRWDGTPNGYEGFLVDCYYALLSVLAREGRLQRTPGCEIPESIP